MQLVSQLQPKHTKAWKKKKKGKNWHFDPASYLSHLSFQDVQQSVCSVARWAVIASHPAEKQSGIRKPDE